MTNQTNTGLVSPVAVAAGEGLIGVWYCDYTVFPPLPFFLYGGPTGGLKKGCSFGYYVSPGAAIFGKFRPLKMADVACTEGLFE